MLKEVEELAGFLGNGMIDAFHECCQCGNRFFSPSNGLNEFRFCSFSKFKCNFNRRVAQELDIRYSIRMKVFTLFDILKATLISKKKITEKK